MASTAIGATELALRLLGDPRGKRLLELGCGTGDAAVAFARAGATVIAVDTDVAAVSAARDAAERAEVRLELHAGDLADLAFLRADSIDLAYSDTALAHVADPNRAFRQVHRVLRAGSPFVFTLPHPVALVTSPEPHDATEAAGARLVVSSSYFDELPHVDEPTGELLHPHTFGSVFAALTRAGFRVDALVEPEPPRTGRERPLLPPAVVWRARKEGV